MPQTTELEFEVEVADGIHETRVSTEIEKRKEQIRNKAYRELHGED